MADEYIKRDDAIAVAMDYQGQGNAQDASQDIAAGLSSIPAADVRPVVRGEWRTDTGHIFCSICGDCEDWKRNFCPNCGADMRGEEEKA